MRRRTVPVVVVVVLALAASVPLHAVATPDSIDDSTGAQPAIADRALQATVDGYAPMAPSVATVEQATVDDDVIDVAIGLRLAPDRPGQIEGTMVVRVPEQVTRLTLELDETVTVEDEVGFERKGPRRFEWTGDTHEPRLEFAMDADVTGSSARSEDPAVRGSWLERDSTSLATADASHDGRRGEPNAAPLRDDELIFADAGSWALVRVPQVGASWSRLSSAPSVTLERRATVDGPGATGGEIAYLGGVTEYERSVRGERIRLAVADEADLAESVDDVLDSIADASDRLRVGGRSEEVFVVAVPTDAVKWGAKGIQYGPDDMWVAADARLGVAQNVWVHEYVHSRQDYETTEDTRWLIEGQADYYAGLVTLEQERIDFYDFRTYLDRGRRGPEADAVLREYDTWLGTDANYLKGRLVAGVIDREIRAETAGSRSDQHVFEALNRAEGPIDHETYLDIVAGMSGPDARAVAATYSETDATPDVWSLREHRESFGQTPAQFDVRLAGEQPYRLTGPFRNRSAAAVPVLVTGETLSVTASLENVGGAGGTYDAALLVDGRSVATSPVELEPDERATATLSWSPDEPGRYSLVVGEDRTTVRVRDPATPTVVDLEISPTTVEPGEPVTLTATVVNDAAVPGTGEVEFRTPVGDPVARTVSLDVGASTTIAVETTFDEPGNYEVWVSGDHRATVAVRHSSIVGPMPVPSESVPGFGPVVAAIAVSTAIVVVRRRA